MATDIVIQLRELASSIERGNGKSTLYGAADEIERLRSLNVALAKCLELTKKELGRL